MCLLFSTPKLFSYDVSVYTSSSISHERRRLNIRSRFRFVWPDSGFRHRGTADDHAAASSSRPTAVALPTLGPRSPPPSHFQAKGTRAHNDLAQHCAGWWSSSRVWQQPGADGVPEVLGDAQTRSIGKQNATTPTDGWQSRRYN